MLHRAECLHTKNVLAPFEAVKQLTRLSPFSAKPKRRPHFGGEGYPWHNEVFVAIVYPSVPAVRSALRRKRTSKAMLLSPFSAKPKRRLHFGGEGYNRGAKTDPVFAPLRRAAF